MASPVKSSNGKAPVRVTLMADAGHAGRMTRAASWLVNVAIPKLIPDHRTAPLNHRTAPLRQRARATPTTGWSEAPAGSSVAGTSEARRIPTVTPDEQRGQVVRDRHSAPDSP